MYLMLLALDLYVQPSAKSQVILSCATCSGSPAAKCSHEHSTWLVMKISSFASGGYCNFASAICGVVASAFGHGGVCHCPVGVGFLKAYHICFNFEGSQPVLWLAS